MKLITSTKWHDRNQVHEIWKYDGEKFEIPKGRTLQCYNPETKHVFLSRPLNEPDFHKEN